MEKEGKEPRVFIRDEEGLKLLAETLKAVRKKKKISQEELAFQSGLSLSQIARIETCKINPTVSTMFQIARTLNIPVSELFDFVLKK